MIKPQMQDLDLKLSDIIDLSAIQSLLHDFYRVARIPLSIVDLKGKALVGVGGQEICLKFHRSHPETRGRCVESDTRLCGGVPQGEFKLYKCLNNMWDIATPLFVCGKHMGNVISGQFLFEDETIDDDFFRSQAGRYGFDENAYLAALHSIPRLSRSHVMAGMSFFIKIADVVSNASYDNIRLAQSVAERDALMVSLRESREDLNRAQAVAQTGSWRLDVRRNELTWSDETFRIFKMPHDTSLTYEKFLSFLHPEDREYVDRKWSVALLGEPYDIEHRIVVEDTVSWVRERAELEFDSAGSLLGGFGTVQDITDRKLAEANQVLQTEILRILNRGGELYPLISETLRLIHLASGFDAVGMRLRSNEDFPFFAQSGFSEDFLLAENSLCRKGLDGEIVRDEKGRAVLECACGLVLSGETDPGMDCFTRAGSFWTNGAHELLSIGSEVGPSASPRNRCIHAGYESIGLFPVRSGERITGLLQLNGRRAGLFTPELVAFYETLAQNIGLALQRTMAEESLRESEDKYRSLYDEAPVGYVELDCEGRIVRVNKMVLEMLGYAAIEMLGKPLWNFVVEQQKAEVAIRATLSGKAPPNKALERIYRRKDGSGIPVVLEGKVVRSSDGRISGVRTTIQDITERKQMEEELRRSRNELEIRVQERTAELESKNRQLQEFAFVASHDLNEPLRKIQTFGSLLKECSADRISEQEADYISRMIGAADRMRDLLDALLRYSRLDTMVQEFRPLRLDELVRDAASDLEVTIQSLKAHLEIGPLPMVMGDPHQLRQLFQNLIANSVKYYRSEVKPFIKVSGEERNGLCRIFVEDNGIGFDEKYLEKIFQPFQRLHGKKEYPGTGIGLAICKKIVDRHGGTITAKSAPGKGSTFVITLPLNAVNRSSSRSEGDASQHP